MRDLPQNHPTGAIGWAPPKEPRVQDEDTIISCHNVWKVFGKNPGSIHFAANPTVEALRESGHVAAVRNVSLSIRRGEMLVVMGLSGSGKSTLVRCLSRLIDITSGAVMVNDRDIGAMTERELIELRRAKMGMVFQSFGLLPHRTALENVAFPLEMRGQGRDARLARAQAMLDLVGLKGREGYFPRELSGGQQQRVGIARSLAVEPDIWFLDEPFSALDPLIRREMQDEFLRLKAKMSKTIVFITHDFDEAIRLADRIAIMKDGAIEQCDTPERIVMSPATSYVAKFTSAVDRGRIIRAGTLAEAPNGRPAEGAAIRGDLPLRSLARGLVCDTRDLIPVVSAAGAKLGVLDRSRAVRLLFEEDI